MASTPTPDARRCGRRVDTFEAVAAEWLALQSKALSSETMAMLGARLKSFLYPYIGKRPVGAITAQELLGTLRRIEARGRHETAHRVRALAGRVLRFAVATGRAQHDVAADLKDALAPVKSQNFASVTDPVRVGELYAGDRWLQRAPGDGTRAQARAPGVRAAGRVAGRGMVGIRPAER